MLPLVKLLTLTLKQISKPVAKNLLIYAGEHPRFRQRCAVIGNKFHYLTCWLQGRRNYHELGIEAAVSLAIDSLTEVMVVVVAAVIIIYELADRAENEREKQRDLAENFEELSESIEAIRTRHKEIGLLLRHTRELQAKRTAWGSSAKEAAAQLKEVERTLSFSPLAFPTR
eukprot:NODE_8077_length_725_cov_10.971761_g7825_i0.p1 GENE.NODE_8077_length_725_cov_10.971761_g7825_i0~~NODE_8077_length_725_cov_10.971761_g7825_i0.p1  ORF type:complete len:171 (+),score=17.82 NODE_8077_length_725_cov_10.971761_g7825_i0:43-555(+)